MKAALAVVFVLLWQLVALRSPLVPSPSEVVSQIGFQITKRGALHELIISLGLNLQAIAIATFIALAFAYAYVIPVMRPIASSIGSLRYAGIVGISIFFLVFIADSHWVKVAILVFSLTSYLVVPMVQEVVSIEDSRFNHARTLKLGHWETTYQVIIRGRLYEMIEVVRQNAPIAWMMVATVEGMIRTEGGIGVLLVEQAKYMRIADILALLTLVFALGILQDKLIRLVGNLVCPYATLNTRSM